ncbi:hypothetical protein AERO8C_50162 [Aeromonas veronii]|uniref:Uncharacterized protein n=1 Tax=Aeromonas veronii TaxID=654 RepID=A0A653L8H4_AERVE|nr:hypothetical protein AERO8C_50162 [Aeromonas veronii]
MLSNHDVSSPIIGTAILSFKHKASVGGYRMSLIGTCHNKTRSVTTGINNKAIREHK